MANTPTNLKYDGDIRENDYAINNCGRRRAALVLMIGFKVNGFIALWSLAAVVVLPKDGCLAVLHSIQNGIGGTLGGLAMIANFGAMLGKLISDTGAAPAHRHHVNWHVW